MKYLNKGLVSFFLFLSCINIVAMDTGSDSSSSYYSKSTTDSESSASSSSTSLDPDSFLYKCKMGKVQIVKHETVKNKRERKCSDCFCISYQPVHVGNSYSLDLFYNRLRSLDGIGTVENVELVTILKLGHNELKFLPDEIRKLENLKVLKLYMNKLIELPDAIGDLTQLEDLDVSRNKLTGLPNSMGKLGKLKKLNLQKNRLSVLPSSFVELSELEELDVSDNSLQSLPKGFDKLESLKVLNVEMDTLKKFRDDISRLPQLESITLTEDQLKHLLRHVVPDGFPQLQEVCYGTWECDRGGGRVISKSGLRALKQKASGDSSVVIREDRDIRK